ncbi:DUF559 domain-containing protein [Leptothrix sp. BB-4]
MGRAICTCNGLLSDVDRQTPALPSATCLHSPPPEGWQAQPDGVVGGRALQPENHPLAPLAYSPLAGGEFFVPLLRRGGRRSLTGWLGAGRQSPDTTIPPPPSPPSRGLPAQRDEKDDAGMCATSGGGGSPRFTRTYRALPFNPQLKDRAKALRRAGNLSEALLWNQLKKGQLGGLDFDRQKIIGNYIVDFYCAERGVVIEVDGRSHDHRAEDDARHGRRHRFPVRTAPPILCHRRRIAHRLNAGRRVAPPRGSALPFAHLPPQEGRY